MDGVAVAIDPEKMDPRSRIVYQTLAEELDEDTAALDAVLAASAGEAVEQSLNELYDRSQDDDDVAEIVAQLSE